ncbi:hypothetical protein I4U23_022684 [Adineta vaga]|nr:hypothetical protein I4U23_022684 [Adineta vaga]
MVLQICSYLVGADVLSSFYKPNARINITITDYCHHLDLRGVTYHRFDYVASYILPRINSISVDVDSVYLNISEVNSASSSITASFALMPCERRLHVGIEEWSHISEFNQPFNKSSALTELMNFHLYMMDFACTLDKIADILQQMPSLQTFTFDLRTDDKRTLISANQSLVLNLPHLEELQVSGKCTLFDLLNAAPNLNDLNIDFDCLKVLLDDMSTCKLLQQQIITLTVCQWTDIELHLFRRLFCVYE